MMTIANSGNIDPQHAEAIHRMFELYGFDYNTLKVNPSTFGVAERFGIEIIDTADTLVEIGPGNASFTALMHDLIDGLDRAARTARR